MKCKNIFAKAVEHLDQKIESDGVWIDSVQKVEWNELEEEFVNVQITVKVNSDVLQKA